jgi:FXSXX-COOH protein
VNSEARPDGTRSGGCLIPDLRGVALDQLASRAAAGEREVTGVVSRIAESRESPSGVAVMMFNNSI